jgi:hypothetical protein
MNFLLPVFLISCLLISGFATADWSIADPSDSGNTAYIEEVEEQGYWNFEWDPTNPISAAMYCCWWEMVHGTATKKYSDALNSASSGDSSSSDSTSSSVETKSYCPACDIDESFDSFSADPEVQELSDQLMATKPWLKEGKTGITSQNNIKTNNSSTKIFSFSKPVKV